MAQNTALQELIEWCKTHHVFRSSQSETEFYNKATELLPKERQQIIDTHKAGMLYGQELQIERRNEGKFPNKENAEQYFTNTFNQ